MLDGIGQNLHMGAHDGKFASSFLLHGFIGYNGRREEETYPVLICPVQKVALPNCSLAHHFVVDHDGDPISPVFARRMFHLLSVNV